MPKKSFQIDFKFNITCSNRTYQCEVTNKATLGQMKTYDIFSTRDPKLLTGYR